MSPLRPHDVEAIPLMFQLPVDAWKTAMSALPSPLKSLGVLRAVGVGGVMVPDPPLTTNCPAVDRNPLDVTTSHFFSLVLAAILGL